MARQELHKRVAQLEKHKTDVRHWHWLVARIRESMEDAQARYEGEHGTIPDSDGLICWISKPCPVREAVSHA